MTCKHNWQYSDGIRTCVCGASERTILDTVFHYVWPGGYMSHALNSMTGMHCTHFPSKVTCEVCLEHIKEKGA